MKKTGTKWLPFNCSIIIEEQSEGATGTDWVDFDSLNRGKPKEEK